MEMSSESIDELSHPVLYAIDKSGKERMWKVWTENNVLFTEYGVVGGKAIRKSRFFEATKTQSANEKAKREAESSWVSQLSKSYVPKCKEGLAIMKKVQDESNKSGGHNINASAVVGGRKLKNTTPKTSNLTVDVVQLKIKPMKAHELCLDVETLSLPSKVAKHIVIQSGVYLQPKYDGWRCIARIQDTSVVLTTNNLKQYPFFEKIRKDLMKLLTEFSKKGVLCIDGELYCHKLVRENGEEVPIEERFPLISGICSIANKSPHPLEDQMKFVFFDVVCTSPQIQQSERFSIFDNVAAFVKTERLQYLQASPRKEAYSLEEVVEYHDSNVSDNFEGVMVRAKDLVYTQNRNLKLRKFKMFKDVEGEVVGVEKNVGVGNEMFVFVVKLPGGTVRAKPTGTEDKRLKMYANRDYYIGKNITLKFQEYLTSGIPRFPTTNGVIREDK